MEKVGRIAQGPFVLSTLTLEMSHVAIMSEFEKFWSCVNVEKVEREVKAAEDASVS